MLLPQEKSARQAPGRLCEVPFVWSYVVNFTQKSASRTRLNL